MNAPAPTRVSAAALQQAFDALARYTAGSSRGALVPLDEAVAQAAADPAAAHLLETRLLGLLAESPPPEAVEYLCRQLALLGSPAAVPALVGLLPHPALSHAAQHALEILPHPEAGRALCAALPTLQGLPLLGVLNTLGRRREPASVPSLAPLLTHPQAPVAAAAAAALGQIGTPEAARALHPSLPQAPAAVRPAFADACLACAERLVASAENTLARALCSWCLQPDQPPHVQAAATAILARLAPPATP